MSREDWTLLAIHFGNARGLTPVQIQKSLFLLGVKCGDVVGDEFYQFEPYHYGPFDARVYHDAEALEEQNLIAIERAGLHGTTRYIATEAGSNKAKELEEMLDQKGVNYLRRATAWCKARSFQQLVRDIYTLFPRYRENSVFRD